MVMFYANAAALPLVDISVVGSYDTLTISADNILYLNPDNLSNSGSATEEAWIEGVLGATDVDYTQLSGSGGSVWYEVTGAGAVAGDYVFDLSAYSDPDNFLVKTGEGQLVDSHWLFDNNISKDWVFFNIYTVFGTTTDNYGVISHIGVTGDTPVPEPSMLGFLAIGIFGMVIARRRTKV